MLAAALTRYPDGYFFAIAATGLFVPMPETVDLSGHRVIENCRSALDLVVPGDRLVVTETWYEVLAAGVSTCQVHPVKSPTRWPSSASST